MTKYHIVTSKKAYEDLSDLFRCIAYDYKAPMTAFKYLRELRQTIGSLEIFPYAHAVPPIHYWNNSMAQMYAA